MATRQLVDHIFTSPGMKRRLRVSKRTESSPFGSVGALRQCSPRRDKGCGKLCICRNWMLLGELFSFSA